MKPEADQRGGIGPISAGRAREHAAAQDFPTVRNNAPSDLETLRREFDEGFYRSQSPELDFAKMEPLVHFLTRGWREGRDPAPWFSVADYLGHHEDVRNTGANPFLHYLLHGRQEQRHIVSSRADWDEPPINAPAEAVAAPTPSKLRGRFERIRDGVAEGWAFDEAQPDLRLMVELWLATKLLCVATAGAEREDLKTAGIGDGRHCFAIRLPRLASQHEPVAITARIAGKDFILGTLEADISTRGLNAVIEQVAGLTITANFTPQSEYAEGTTVHVLLDGLVVAKIDTPSLPAGASYRATAALPPTVLDGGAHWFRLALADTAVPSSTTFCAPTLSRRPKTRCRLTPKSFQLHVRQRPSALCRAGAAIGDGAGDRGATGARARGSFGGEPISPRSTPRMRRSSSASASRRRSPRR